MNAASALVYISQQEQYVAAVMATGAADILLGILEESSALNLRSDARFDAALTLAALNLRAAGLDVAVIANVVVPLVQELVTNRDGVGSYFLSPDDDEQDHFEATRALWQVLCHQKYLSTVLTIEMPVHFKGYTGVLAALLQAQQNSGSERVQAQASVALDLIVQWPNFSQHLINHYGNMKHFETTIAIPNCNCIWCTTTP